MKIFISQDVWFLQRLVFKLYRVKAVNDLQSFSNTIGHQSINGLCLALSLCKCYKWMLHNAPNQIKIFRLNRSFTTPRSESIFKSLNELPLEIRKCLTKSFLHAVHTLQGYSFWNSIDHRSTSASATSAWRQDRVYKSDDYNIMN